MRYACYHVNFKKVGYVRLNLCEVFREEHQAQAYCIENQDYEYTKVDEYTVYTLLLSE